MIKSETRDSYFDNIKAILIILVVVGHLLESFLGVNSFKFLYTLVYSFHMPLFVFCSGCFACRDNHKILKRIIYPYLVFQVLYLIFNKFILGADTAFTFTTPYWILWYLFSLVIWSITIQFIKKVNITIISISFLIGILIGFDNSVGYYMSLSRTLVFLPFFLLGYYCKTQQKDIKKLKISKSFIAMITLMSILTAIILYANLGGINTGWLYNSYSYSSLKYSWMIRIGIYVASIILSILVMISVPRMHISVLTTIGERSMSIFLLHGFFVKAIQKVFPFSALSSGFLISSYLIIFTMIIVLLLSTKFVFIVFQKVFPK